MTKIFGKMEQRLIIIKHSVIIAIIGRISSRLKNKSTICGASYSTLLNKSNTTRGYINVKETHQQIARRYILIPVK